MALASAKLFAEERAYVFITGRRLENLDDVVKAIGRKVTAVQADSAKLADLDRLYETVKREKGNVDVAFASAGHGRSRAPGGDHRRAVRQPVFPKHPRHTLYRAESAAPDERRRIDHYERIDRSRLGMPGLSVYAGSKAALRSFARSWAVELAERRIRVNVLSPGPIATNALTNLPAEAKEYFLSGIPRKELGHPEEIATTARFLASNDSTFVNGSEICVDGGMAQI
jgi:NAD(P)-dependent dehydrogenase (short-subunit alcohol dehydrogenase family)